MNLREALRTQSPSLALQRAAADEIARLDQAIRYEENRFTHIGTHSDGCWSWGPKHYECAVRHIEALNKQMAAVAEHALGRVE